MAVPSNAQVRRGFPLKSGVMLGISPSSDPTFDVEIARSSTGAYTTIARLTGKGEGVPVSFTDILPVDGQYRSYKARAVKDGWLAGDYTDVLEVKPIQLPEIGPNITPITARPIGVDVFLTTGQSLQYGSPVTPSSYKKSVRVAGTAFRVKSTGVSYSYGVGTLVPTTRNPSTVANYTASIGLPTGATIYKTQWIYSRTSANAVVRVELYSVSTNGTATLRYGKTSTATAAPGTQVLSSSSFSFTMASNYLIAQAALKSTAAGGNTAGLVAMDVFYRTPTVQDAL